MARINQELLRRLRTKLGVKRSQVYKLISRKVRETHLPRHLAVVVLASEVGINPSKYTSDADLKIIRSANLGLVLPQLVETSKEAQKKGGRPARFDAHIPDDPFISDKDISAALRNAELYPTLFIFENSIRRFVAAMMNSEFGDDWWETEVTLRIRNSVDIRRSDERNYPWHSRRGAEPIYYTDIDDLKKIMNANNACFRKVLGKKYERVHIWIEDIEKTRNILAHNNPVAKKDIDRLRMQARDWSELLKAIIDQII